jgi:hypothetical protein
MISKVYMPSDRLLNGMQFLAPLRGELSELYTAVIYGGRRLAVRAPEWEGEPIERLTYELPDGLEVRVYATEPNVSRLIYHTRQDRLTAWQRIVETFLKQTPPHQN